MDVERNDFKLKTINKHKDVRDKQNCTVYFYTGIQKGFVSFKPLVYTTRIIHRKRE